MKRPTRESNPRWSRGANRYSRSASTLTPPLPWVYFRNPVHAADAQRVRSCRRHACAPPCPLDDRPAQRQPRRQQGRHLRRPRRWHLHLARSRHRRQIPLLNPGPSPPPPGAAPPGDPAPPKSPPDCATRRARRSLGPVGMPASETLQIERARGSLLPCSRRSTRDALRQDRSFRSRKQLQHDEWSERRETKDHQPREQRAGARVDIARRAATRVSCISDARRARPRRQKTRSL